MKKRTIGIACALAGLAGTAHASVTLYGVVDANIEYSNNNLATGQPDGKSKVALSSGGLSPSRWGLRGVEDLGGGKQAIFALESGFSVDTGISTQGGRLFGRQAWVGLAAGQHKLTFGRQYSSLFLTMANYSPTAYATLYEPVTTIAGMGLRQDNMVKYQGDFGPLSTQLHWSFGEQPGSMTGSAGYGAGVDYRIGSFGIAAAYDNVNSPKVAGDYQRTQKAALGLRYKITPQLLAQAAYRYGKNDVATPGAIGRDDLWWFALNYQATPALQLTGAVYYDNLRSVYGAAGSAPADPANPWQVTMIADYSLSKRTDVYLSAAFTKNAALNFENFNGATAAYRIAPNEDSQFGVAVGIRHRF